MPCQVVLNPKSLYFFPDCVWKIHSRRENNNTTYGMSWCWWWSNSAITTERMYKIEISYLVAWNKNAGFSPQDDINDDTLFWLEPFWGDGFGATTRFRSSQFRKNRGKKFTNQKLLLGFWRTRTRRFLPWRVARKRRRSPKERQVSQLLCLWGRLRNAFRVPCVVK